MERWPTKVSPPSRRFSYSNLSSLTDTLSLLVDLPEHDTETDLGHLEAEVVVDNTAGEPFRRLLSSSRRADVLVVSLSLSLSLRNRR